MLTKLCLRHAEQDDEMLIFYIQTFVFLSCPLVKKHADLFGSFLY